MHVKVTSVIKANEAKLARWATIILSENLSGDGYHFTLSLGGHCKLMDHQSF